MGDNNPGITMTKMSVSIMLHILALSAIVFMGFTLQQTHYNSTANVLENEAVIIDEAEIRKYQQTFSSGVDVYAEVRNHLNDGLGIYICNSNMKGSSILQTQNCQVYGAKPTGTTTDAANACNVTVSYVNGRFQIPSLSGDYNTDVSPTVDSGEHSLTYIEQSTEWYSDIVYQGNTSNFAGIIFIQKY